jgi:hypothetical protein
MSRSDRRQRRAQRHRESSGQQTAQSGRRAPAPTLIVLAALALLLLAAATAWNLTHRRSAGASLAQETLPLAVLLDSVRAAEQARDWARSARWFQRVAAAAPTNSRYLLGLALSQHNLMSLGEANRPGRSMARTSLDRIRVELQVLALLDSAAANARDNDEWTRARRWSGQTYDNLGLPLDALQIYTEIWMRNPGFQPALARSQGQLRILRDPQALPASDTTQSSTPRDDGLR